MTQVQWLQSLQAIVGVWLRTTRSVVLSMALVTAAAFAQAPPASLVDAAKTPVAAVQDLQNKAIEAMADQRWAVAEDLLLQAQHALHRQYGVVTDRQAPILDQLARTHVAQKDYRQANRFKEFNYFLGQRSSSIDAQAQAEIALARWYLYSGQFDAARRLLSASLKTELAREPFVPERALLRLDVELFSTQCCHSDDAIALLGRAKAHGVSADLILQFEQRVANLLVLDGQAKRSADHYAQQTSTEDQAPQLISGLRRYNNLAPNKMSDLKIRQELRRRGILTNGYPDDELWSEPPKTYTVALSEDFLPVAEATQPEFGGHTDKFEPVIGAPFRFNVEQLKQALPTRYRKLARLETLEIVMTLDITDEGKPKNIRFEGRYPRQIRELMKQVFKVARFKPATRNGLPIETLDFRFVQRFKAGDNQNKADV